MSMLERISDEYLAEYLFKTEANSIDILVNWTTRPDSLLSEWDFEIRAFSPFGDDLLIRRESDAGFLCDCEECKNFGSELLDYYALHSALTWMEENGDFKGEVNVWTRSNELLIHSTNRFDIHKCRYECPYLQIMDEDLHIFAERLTLKVASYTELAAR